MKIYALFANGQLYDDSESLSTVQRWFESFSSAITKGELPHRWFYRFMQDEKLLPIKLEIKELDSDLGKVLKHKNFK